MNKKNIILGAVLLFLIIAAVIYDGPVKNWQQNSGKVNNFLVNIDVDKITKIEIERDDRKTVLEKQGDRYKIVDTKDFYVDEMTTSALRSILEEAKASELEVVSKTDEKKIEFSVDKKQGVNIKLFQDSDNVAEFIVGKMTGDYAGSYISQSDTEKTFSINSNLAGIFGREDWYDYKIFSSDKTVANKIRFQYPTREFTIEKGEEGWKGTLPYGFSVNQEKIDKIIDIMTNLKATEIPEQDFEKSGLAEHSIIVQLSGPGLDNTLMIGDKNGESMYYAKKGSSDNIYLISDEQREMLEKQIWELK